jgi:predicted RNA-binding Zn ribbon-like protein
MSSGAHPLPSELAVVLSFVNSVDIEVDTDEWAADPQALAGWLTLNGLVAGGVRVSPAEFDLACDLRAGLRAMTLANNGVPAEPVVLDKLRATLKTLPLTVVPDTDGGGALNSTADGSVMAALGVIVAGYATGLLTGDWSRMRQCPAGDCAWVFWDSSAKAARRWCKMRVCGNRAKVRAFTERRRAAESASA